MIIEKQNLPHYSKSLKYIIKTNIFHNFPFVICYQQFVHIVQFVNLSHSEPCNIFINDTQEFDVKYCLAFQVGTMKEHR